MKNTILWLVLFTLFPAIANAETFKLPSGLLYSVEEKVMRWFTLPSGLQILAEVRASELTLEEQIIQYIYHIEDINELPRKRLERVAWCESRFNITAVGDRGKAYGIFQFWERTFNAFKKEAGMSELEYKNWRHQTELAGWAFSNNKESHWTCR